MMRKRIVLRAEMPEMPEAQEKSYIQSITEDVDGFLDYTLTSSPENASSYELKEMKNEHSRLHFHLKTIQENFKELLVSAEVLVTQTVPYDVFMRNRSKKF